MPSARLLHGLLHYELDGPEDAPVVVLLNSLGTNLHLWDGQMAALAGYRVLRYDTRGHGESDVFAGLYALEDLGGDVVALLDLLHIDRAHVCGISLGGMTALWLGVHAPERVRSVMACNTAARIGNAAAWNARMAQVGEHGMASIADATMERWFTGAFRARESKVVDDARRMLCNTDAGGYASCCAALRDADLSEQVASILLPTLVISGTHDPVTPVSDGRFLHRQIVGSRFAELDASHLSNLEDVGSFSRAVLDFLASTDDALASSL